MRSRLFLNGIALFVKIGKEHLVGVLGNNVAEVLYIFYSLVKAYFLGLIDYGGGLFLVHFQIVLS